MLKECHSHGYFRDEFCPVCGSEAKFLLNDQEVEMLGRTMAGVLRHFPERYGLEMDGHGWVDLRDFITAVQIRNKRFRFLRSHHIVGLVETDPKGRYQFLDGKIRATYGHSLDVDLDLPTENVPDVLFYPTTQEEAHLLFEAGLRPADRKMVHLSATFEAAMEAGRVRSQAPIILEIDAKAARAAGIVIAKAGKTVYVSKEVPGEYLARSSRVEEELPPSEPDRLGEGPS
ncbi:MAG TPA: RNA 2'-phosphotransferase [Thermoplasmata archaeon]|nr:RNA 2'-phosphotransferase [Thermoplasmata archaeon]